MLARQHRGTGTMTTLLEIEGLSKTFPVRIGGGRHLHRAVNGVDLTLDRVVETGTPGFVAAGVLLGDAVIPTALSPSGAVFSADFASVF